jgi:hypothetical protein
MDHRMIYVAALAAVGLTIRTFDGDVLTLAYDDAADPQGRDRDRGELSGFASSAMSEAPGCKRMFPELQKVVIDFGTV